MFLLLGKREYVGRYDFLRFSGFSGFSSRKTLPIFHISGMREVLELLRRRNRRVTRSFSLSVEGRYLNCRLKGLAHLFGLEK